MRRDIWSPVCVDGYTSKKSHEYGRDAETNIEATNTIKNDVKFPIRENATVKQEDRDFGRC